MLIHKYVYHILVVDRKEPSLLVIDVHSTLRVAYSCRVFVSAVSGGVLHRCTRAGSSGA